MIRHSTQHSAPRPPVLPPAALRHAGTVLVVEAPNALRLLDSGPSRQSVVLTQLRMLSARMLAQVAPDAIIGPLIADGWDSLDLATTLEDMGYRGNLYILSRPLPRAELVLREVRAFCPALTINLVETP